MITLRIYRYFPKLLLCASIAQCISAYSEPVSNNVQLSPIISVQEEKEETKKDPPAPGLSFGAPSASGASGGSIFVGISYGADVDNGILTFYDDEGLKRADGSMNAGFGIGDPNKLAAEVTVGIISVACQDGESCFGADGTMGLKFHKKIDGSFINGIALAYSDIVRWGEASDFATIYGVASKDLKIMDKDALLSLGIGTGGFRSLDSINQDENDPNLFGGIGIKLNPRVSLASSWNGSTLGAGFGISPFYFPLSVSAGVVDITEVHDKGMQYSINLGYSFSF